MDEPHSSSAWVNYLPALTRALGTMEQALREPDGDRDWVSGERDHALALIQRVEELWQNRIDPNLELTELKILCWNSPIQALGLVRTNLELICAWREEIIFLPDA